MGMTFTEAMQLQNNVAAHGKKQKKTFSGELQKILENSEKARKSPGKEEHYLQRDCVAWFRSAYPEYALLLFAVPNGGARSKATGGILKAEGVVAGVSDLILLLPNSHYASLCIEMKKEKGYRQGDTQKLFQAAVESHGSKYALINTQEKFEEVVNSYMADVTL